MEDENLQTRAASRSMQDTGHCSTGELQLFDLWEGSAGDVDVSGEGLR